MALPLRDKAIDQILRLLSDGKWYTRTRIESYQTHVKITTLRDLLKKLTDDGVLDRRYTMSDGSRTTNSRAAQYVEYRLPPKVVEDETTTEE